MLLPGNKPRSGFIQLASEPFSAFWGLSASFLDENQILYWKIRKNNESESLLVRNFILFI